MALKNPVTLSSVRLATLNCRSAKNSFGSIKQLCQANDIILLQEHWLLPNELNYLDHINTDFLAFGSSAVQVSDGLLTGRPYGGTAVLYRKHLAAHIRYIHCDSKRVTACTLNVSVNNVECPILIASVYMPTFDHTEINDLEFEDVVGCLSALICDCSVSGYLLCGDFNFQFNTTRHKMFMDILSRHNAVSADEHFLDKDSFTYISDSHATVSWLDHVYINAPLLSAVSDLKVLYDCICSDHRPLQFVLHAVLEVADRTHGQESVCQVPDWIKCNQNDLDYYATYLANLLQQQQLFMPSVCCVNNCTNVDHHVDIDMYLSKICECVRQATTNCIPNRVHKSSEYCIAGWNDLVADKHAAARTAFLEWSALGRARTGLEYQMMKRTRSQFKLALRYCKSNEEQLQCDALAQDYLANNADFWKKVKVMSNGKMTKCAAVVGEAKDDPSIAKLWKQSFEQLYSQRSNDSVLADARLLASDSNFIITVNDVNDAVQNLKCRKSCGPDGLASEAIKYGGSALTVHLTLLFNMFTSHCYIPADFTMTTIVPLLKNKAADTSDMANYRAIALSNSVSKVLENVLLKCFQSYDDTDDCCQFGFKRKHSTTLACSTLKCTVEYFRQHGSYVFVCMLDLSKAFDSVDHNVLFRTLLKLELPGNLLKLLAYWYSNQHINIRWKHVVTDSFSMTNGTRQGSILSPYLFSVYIRSVSTSVRNSLVGCHIGVMPCNILLYADDIVLIAPTWHAQQRLLDICSRAVKALEMKFNGSKSVTLIFPPHKPRWRVEYEFPAFTLDGCQLSVVRKCKYLGHFISVDDDDNADILYQRGLLFARTNYLLRKFAKCSISVKVCLFKSYCLNVYGMQVWNCYNATVFKKLEAAYVKCIKLFFKFDRRENVANILIMLGVPTLQTLVHNAKFRHVAAVHSGANVLVQYVHEICAMS